MYQHPPPMPGSGDYSQPGSIAKQDLSGKNTNPSEAMNKSDPVVKAGVISSTATNEKKPLFEVNPD